MTRDGLAGMLNEQTTACGPARDALIAGATFVVRDGLVPADRLAHTYRIRLRHTRKHGRSTVALAATVDRLLAAEEELLRIGRIVATDSSWTFMLFLNATATEVPACTGVARTASPADQGSDA
ncbi:hypothetical protein OG948_36405 (plasmid) [Embleya sp. NBC_00888]|uniref:hypothetical protein n=1 Tax=Embleya sp. NBC_00888 TaxID=2975960 RepID=UPI002F90A5ED|nr:hypothetical protein OG948_36405 [Embleya sp. NBC_00888]